MSTRRFQGVLQNLLEVVLRHFQQKIQFALKALEDFTQLATIRKLNDKPTTRIARFVNFDALLHQLEFDPVRIEHMKMDCLFSENKRVGQDVDSRRSQHEHSSGVGGREA